MVLPRRDKSEFPPTVGDLPYRRNSLEAGAKWPGGTVRSQPDSAGPTSRPQVGQFSLRLSRRAVVCERGLARSAWESWAFHGPSISILVRSSEQSPYGGNRLRYVEPTQPLR
jgi:hypothetical protein